MTQTNSLVEDLKSQDRHIRAMALQTLLSLGPDGTRILLDALKSDDVETFRRALKALFTLKQAWSAVPTLIERFRTTNPDIRKTAIRTFGRLRRVSDPAIPHLCQALKSPDPPTRKVAAETLGKIGTSKAIRPLTELLCDSSRTVRSSARFALNKILGKVEESSERTAHSE